MKIEKRIEDADESIEWQEKAEAEVEVGAEGVASEPMEAI